MTRTSLSKLGLMGVVAGILALAGCADGGGGPVLAHPARAGQRLGTLKTPRFEECGGIHTRPVARVVRYVPRRGNLLWMSMAWRASWRRTTTNLSPT